MIEERGIIDEAPDAFLQAFIMIVVSEIGELFYPHFLCTAHEYQATRRFSSLRSWLLDMLEVQCSRVLLRALWSCLF